MFIWLLCILIVFILTIALYVYQIKQMKSLRPINGPPVLPIVGNVLQLFYISRKYSNLNDLMTEMFKRYGKTVQIHIGPFLSLVTTQDPKIAQKIIFSTRESTKSSTYNILKPWMGDGLLTGGGNEKWRKRKKIVAHIFGVQSYLEHYIDNFKGLSQNLVQTLKDFENKDKIDIYPIITLCTLHIIYESVFGSEMTADSKTSSEYVRSMKGISISLLKRILSIKEKSDFIFNLTSNGKRFKECLETIKDLTKKIIQERRKLLTAQLVNNNNTANENDEDGVKKRLSYLDKLLQEQLNGNYLSDADIYEDVSAIIFAGHDTSSYGISFALYLLANHPEIQDKVLLEVKEILGDDKSKMPTITDLNEMRYLELVLKETLRLYPPAPFIGRKLQEDLDLGDIILPANTECMIFLNGMHRSEEYFPNPHDFIPERFLDPDIEKTAYMPFSGGQRKCSGYKYALYEMKMLIADIIRNYELIPLHADYKPEIILGIVSRPRKGLYIKIRPRI